MTIQELQQGWNDTPEWHESVHLGLTKATNKNKQLKKHRDFVETNAFGFGERSFHYLWKILLEDLPECSEILEIGCFRGQTLSLFKMLKPGSNVTGITPLDTSGGMWESDYLADIHRIHNEFGLPDPELIVGKSQDINIYTIATNCGQKMFNMVYIDGSHEYEDCAWDLKMYAPLVKPGGYLVIDDACNDMNMPFGYFQGIEEVTKATLEYMELNGDKWEFVGNVVHLRIYRRK